MDILNFISWIKGGRQVTTVDPRKTLLPVGLKDGRRDDGYLAGAISVEDFLELAALKGESYIVVVGNGADAVANGALLKEAYDFASTATPYGNARSSSNEFTVLVAPGTYDMSAYSGIYGWELNADYVNVISLSGTTDVILTTFLVSGSFCTIKGIDVSPNLGQILIGPSTTSITFDTCIASGYSFGAGILMNGHTFKNCIAGSNSFGSSMVIIPPFGYVAPPQSTPQSVQIQNCTFENCMAGSNSFGAALVDVGIISSTFNKCSTTTTGSPANSFGYAGNFGPGSGTVYIGSASTFTDCKGGSYCFGSNPSFSGGSVLIDSSAVFINCTATSNSFGVCQTGNAGEALGFFKNCTADLYSFGYNPVTRQGIASGTFENCTLNTFEGFGGYEASGLFINCRVGTPISGGGARAFGAGDPGAGYASGTFTNCSSYINNSFGNLTANGIFTNCIAREFSFGRIANGQFNNCVASDYSFAWDTGGTTVTGQFNHCIGGTDSFANNDNTLTNTLFGGRACFCIKNNGDYYTSPGGPKVLQCVNASNQVITI
jgi:hypothetical protein